MGSPCLSGGLLETHPFLEPACIEKRQPLRRVEPDLLLTASILHDLGKVDELLYTRSFNYSDEGQLLGHIILGIERLKTRSDNSLIFQEIFLPLKTPPHQSPWSIHLGSPRNR